MSSFCYEVALRPKGKLRNDYLWTEKAELLVAPDTVFSSLSCAGKD